MKTCLIFNTVKLALTHTSRLASLARAITSLRPHNYQQLGGRYAGGVT